MTLFRFSVRSALIAALWSGQISSAAHTRSMTLSGSESVERNHTLSSMLKCAKEWSSYDSLISANIFTGRETKTYHREKQTTLTYGTGKVYTSSAGIPVAHGTFTSTSFVVTVVTVTKTSTNWPLRTTGTARTQKTPTCSSLLWPDCSRLYSSYISSLGLPWNATVPSIDPPPFNSPACSIYNYQPWTSCHYSTEVDPGCSVSADNVQLFYFEPTTSKAHASVTDIVVHTFAPGTTFSSPSIYLLFNNLTAAAAYYGVDRYCTTCAYGNCVTSELVGAAAMATIGTMVDSTMLAFAPEQVSTVLASFGPRASQHSAVNAIARNGPGYSAAVNTISYPLDVINGGALTTQQIRLEDIRHPPPTAYYLNPLGVPGCDDGYPSPECSTIFEGYYRPMLALPTQIIGLRDFWKGCHPYVGVSDPPTVVKPTTMAKPKMHPGNRIRQLSADIDSRDTAITTDSVANGRSLVSQWLPILPSPSPTVASETSIATS